MKKMPIDGESLTIEDVVAVSRDGAEAFASYLLEKARLVTVSGSGFGKVGEGHLRISYSVSYGQVREGMKRIRQCLHSRT